MPGAPLSETLTLVTALVFGSLIIYLEYFELWAWQCPPQLAGVARFLELDKPRAMTPQQRHQLAPSGGRRPNLQETLRACRRARLRASGAEHEIFRAFSLVLDRSQSPVQTPQWVG